MLWQIVHGYLSSWYDRQNSAVLSLAKSTGYWSENILAMCLKENHQNILNCKY